MNNRIFVRFTLFLGILFAMFPVPINCDAAGLWNNAPKMPNIILIMTDDLGIGDLGYQGNPLVKTPHIDRLASHSTRFTNFHVHPVCSPTRAALMTGKYPEKTGIYDTYHGGSIMATEEVTLAEILKGNGYSTGIFGKWHLGDNYPSRPNDQGFTNSLTHKGGGIGQPGDVDNYLARDSSYFNPVLYKNGNRLKTKGYCSDVFTDGAVDFIKQNDGSPFFLYLSFNAPHTPLQVPQKYYNLYQNLSLATYKEKFGNSDVDVTQMTEKDLDDARKVYGMVTNIDDNIGILLKALKSKKIDDNTIIIFMSDNGPEQRRYKLGYRGRKSSVHEAGVRVPFFVYGPKNAIPVNKEVSHLSAHIDLLPTLIELSGLSADLPPDVDGQSLVPYIKNKNQPAFNRTIFTEWGRGYPIPYQNMSVHKGGYKLVGKTNYNAPIEQFELYNLAQDPLEKTNILSRERERAAGMKAELDDWIDQLSAHPNNRQIQYIKVGQPVENPVILNRNDAKGPVAPWTQSELSGYWDVEITEDGVYDFNFHFFNKMSEPGNMVLKLYPYQFSMANPDTEINKLTLEKVKLLKGKYRLEPHYSSKTQTYIFPFYVEVKKKN